MMMAKEYHISEMTALGMGNGREVFFLYRYYYDIWDGTATVCAPGDTLDLLAVGCSLGVFRLILGMKESLLVHPQTGLPHEPLPPTCSSCFRPGRICASYDEHITEWGYWCRVVGRRSCHPGKISRIQAGGGNNNPNFNKFTYCSVVLRHISFLPLINQHVSM